MKKGLFITAEGPEGAGKTTVFKMIANELEQEGFSIVLTREPGGIPISEHIRDIILDKSNKKMDAKTEALLYAAARRQHLVEKIIPALESGNIVLCDRFIDASIAYQGHARRIGVKEVLSINQFAVEDIMPDLTVYFDIDPEIGLQRIKRNRNEEVNRLDLEDLEFHHLVREGYLLLVDQYPDRIKKVDAGRPIDEVKNEVLLMIKQLIKNEKK